MTKIKVLSVNLGSEISYNASWRDFEKFQSDAAKLKRSIDHYLIYPSITFSLNQHKIQQSHHILTSKW